MRKSATSLEHDRQRIVEKYKRGKLQHFEVRGDASLQELEREMKQEICVYLKAQDFTYAYMASVTGVAASTIKIWFSEEEKYGLHARTALVRQSLLDGAFKLLKSYTIELIEMLMEVARTTESEELAVRVMHDLLDRIGLAKISKSVSAQVNRDEQSISITDTTGLLEIAKNAPPEIQARMAEAAESLVALAQEHAE